MVPQCFENSLSEFVAALQNSYLNLFYVGTIASPKKNWKLLIQNLGGQTEYYGIFRFRQYDSQTFARMKEVIII